MNKLILACAAAVAGCGGDLTAPIRPQPFDPPAVYVGWASDLLLCFHGHPGDPVGLVASIEWRAVEGFENESPGLHIHGEWDDGVVYLRTYAIEWRQAVVHEMIHHLLWGDPMHRDPRWRCQNDPY